METTFKDINRLHQVMDNLGLPHQVVAPTLAAFSSEMNAFYELSIGNSASMGIMMMGKGEKFFQRLAKFLETSAMLKDEVQRFLSYAKKFEYRSIFFKIDLNQKGVEEITYYYRKKINPQEVKGWLNNAGISEAEQEKIAIIFRFLNKDYAQVGVSLIPQEKGSEKIYFTMPGFIASWYKIAAALKAGVKMQDAKLKELFLNHFKTYKNRIFFAVSLKEGQLLPYIQIILFGIAPQKATLFFKQQNFSPSSLQNIDFTLQTSSKAAIDYLGFKLTGTEIKGVKAYFFKEA